MEKHSYQPKQEQKDHKPNETDRLLPIFQEVTEERMTLSGPELVTIIKFIRAVRSDND